MIIMMLLIQKLNRYWFIIYLDIFFPPVSWQIPSFYAYIFPQSYFFVFIELVLSSKCCLHPLSACIARCATKKGREMWGWAGNEKKLCGCEPKYSGVQFMAPIWDPKPIPNTATCTVGDWVYYIRGLYGSMILLPQLRSDCYLSLACAKWVPPFLLSWVNSN